VAWYTERAEAADGDADAMLELGRLLARGHAGERDEPRGVALIERAHRLGSTDATIELARLRLRDASAAARASGIALLEEAAQRGVVGALSELAEWYGPDGGGRDPDREVPWLVRLAATGDFGARERLQQIEATRQHAARTEDAVARAEAAVAAGEPDARRRLAIAYVQKGDQVRAMAVVKDAHAHGERWAWFNMVMRYRVGAGTPASREKARHWMREGAVLGDPGAMLQLADDLFDAGADPVVCAAWVRLAESPRYGAEYGLPNDETREAIAKYTAGLPAEQLVRVASLVERHEASGATRWPDDASGNL
jgi:TPR repeat protein